MKIDHIAMYVNDLEKAKNFFVRYFEGVAGPLYKNPVTRFQSYMISFEDGTRLELMKAAHMTDDPKPLDRTGYAHICFSVATKDEVDAKCKLLKADGFQVKDLNMNAYMEVRALTQKFIDDFLGYWIDPNNSHMSSLLVGCGLPGGMMGSMMADLKGFHGAVNASLRAQGKAELTLDQLMVMLFQEVEYVWPRLGYPPLVTPMSQMVGVQATANVLAGERYKMITKESKGLLRGEYGQVPGKVNEEVRKKAIGDDEVITCRPADLLEPELDKYREQYADITVDVDHTDLWEVVEAITSKL